MTENQQTVEATADIDPDTAFALGKISLEDHREAVKGRAIPQHILDAYNAKPSAQPSINPDLLNTPR